LCACVLVRVYVCVCGCVLVCVRALQAYIIEFKHLILFLFLS